MGSPVVRASDSRSEGLGSMPNATKYPYWNQWVRKSCGRSQQKLRTIFLSPPVAIYRVEVQTVSGNFQQQQCVF
ncbi:hypothetical protein TNCV_2845431 [Trichonephila clavipes]|nr:hypothetical protein TNCV_2845431 [Trichonephila clavipes]